VASIEKADKTIFQRRPVTPGTVLYVSRFLDWKERVTAFGTAIHLDDVARLCVKNPYGFRWLFPSYPRYVDKVLITHTIACDLLENYSPAERRVLLELTRLGFASQLVVAACTHPAG
jgi:hypothetical protein